MHGQKGESATIAERRTTRLAQYPFNEIETPGSYLHEATGSLIRVPAEALAPGHSPLITINTLGETRVSKLSDNPAAPISVLRRIAADNDLFVNF
jgi:hypothetical protein